jgi:hypothetical protein
MRQAGKPVVELSSKEQKNKFSNSNRQVHVDKVIVPDPEPPQKKPEQPKPAATKKSGGRDAAFYALLSEHTHLKPSNMTPMPVYNSSAAAKKDDDDDEYGDEYY